MHKQLNLLGLIVLEREDNSPPPWKVSGFSEENISFVDKAERLDVLKKYTGRTAVLLGLHDCFHGIISGSRECMNACTSQKDK